MPFLCIICINLRLRRDSEAYAYLVSSALGGIQGFGIWGFQDFTATLDHGQFRHTFGEDFTMRREVVNAAQNINEHIEYL